MFNQRVGFEPELGKNAEDTQAVEAHSTQAGGRRISGTWELSSWRQSVTGARAGRKQKKNSSKNEIFIQFKMIHFFANLKNLRLSKAVPFSVFFE